MWLPTDKKYADFIKDYFAVSDRYHAGEMTPADWRAWQEKRLKVVLRHVKSKSKFYQRHLANVDVEAVTLDTLGTLPFTTKDDLRREMLDILSGDLAEAMFFYETTGTTGPATPCPRDAKEVIASNAQLTYGFQHIFEHHFGPNVKPKVALMGPTEAHSFGDTLGDVCRNLGSLNAKIWPFSPMIGFKRCLQLMHELALDVVVTTPGICLTLAKAAEHYGFDLKRDFRVKLFMLTGEMTTPASARNMTSLWGAETYNILYGSQEALVIASACKRNHLHLAMPNYIFEVLDADTRQSQGMYGEGELCVTMLIDGVKPMIRYCTGDFVKIPREYDRCEVPSPPVSVVGRTRDRVRLSGKPHLASQIEEAILEGVRGCLGYQVVIESDAGGRDRVTVKLELLKRPEAEVAAVETDVQRRFQALFDTPTKAEVVDELSAIVHTGSMVSWKASRIVDKRVAADAETQSAQRLAQKRGFRT